MWLIFRRYLLSERDIQAWVLISRTILAEAFKNIIREVEMCVRAPADYTKRLLYICQETIAT